MKTPQHIDVALMIMSGITGIIVIALRDGGWFPMLLIALLTLLTAFGTLAKKSIIK